MSYTPVQSRLFEFDTTTSPLNDNSNTTSRAETFLHISCSYRHRRGLKTDIFNVWRTPEQIDNCSRGDIARAYRLGGGF